MISFFLDPYPEEIMYSAIARNAAALNYPNLRSVGATYFGEPHSVATVAFPCRLKYLATHLPPNTMHTAESFIDKHTLLPLFEPFLPQARAIQLRDNMCNTHGMGTHMRTGVMASTVPMPTHLHLCPVCIEEDRKQYGECFWHRQHQTPGVYVCAKHQVWLEQSSVQLSNRQTRHEYIAAENAFTHMPAPRFVSKTSSESVLLAIALSTQLLLEQRFSSHRGLEHWQERYIQALIKRDLATFNGRVQMSEVLEAFAAFYSKETLAFLHCNLNTQSQDNWLARLVRKPNAAQHPLHHFLLMHFLGENITDCLSRPLKPRTPFGHGPWPCLNPVCKHYRSNVIKKCAITYPPGLNGRPSGTFACTCGFIYGRSGPDKGYDDTYRRGKIIAMGEVWENALRQHLIDNSLSLREISKQLGVNPMTVKRHIQRLGLSTVQTNKNEKLAAISQKMLHSKQTAKAVLKQRDNMRAIWQETCSAYGHYGRKTVRRQAAHVYTWLYRHDRDWLEQHLPPCKKPKSPTRVDWAARDVEISQQIPAVVHHLLIQPGRPSRITIAAIGRSIGCLAMIQQHLDSMPLTAAALAQAEESRKAFAIRRIQWASKHFYTQDRVPQRWELVRRAGVERLLSDVAIQRKLDVAIDGLKRSLMAHEVLSSTVLLSNEESR